MIIDFTQELVNPITGEKILMDIGSTDVVTLSDIAVNALVTPIDGERLDGKTKFELMKFAQKIHNAKDVDITVEEVAKIKERVGVMYPQLLVGAVYELLN